MRQLKDFCRLILIFFAAYIISDQLLTFVTGNIPQTDNLTIEEFDTLAAFVFFIIGLGLYKYWDRSKIAQYIIMIIGGIAIIRLLMSSGVLPQV